MQYVCGKAGRQASKGDFSGNCFGESDLKRQEERKSLSKRDDGPVD